MAFPFIPVLPKSANLEYLAEGAANVVYRISISTPSPGPSELDQYGDGTPPPTEIDTEDVSYVSMSPFENKLLRVRKDLLTTIPCATSQDAWLRHIAPLFPEHQLVNQTLVELRSSGAITHLNIELETCEKLELTATDRRPAKRHGVYLADDDHGLLVTDMTSGSTDDLVVQFKPKWLARSPSAPEGSKRCRQCALVARKNAARATNGGALETAFCVFDLVSSSYQENSHVAKMLVHSGSSKDNIERLARWINKTSLLRRLRDIQITKDTQGVLAPDRATNGLLVAMTLRDCSVFVRFPADPANDEEIEARIGDLDVKSPAKLQYWQASERALIDEGWYMGTEPDELRQPIICSLNRGASLS